MKKWIKIIFIQLLIFLILVSVLDFGAGLVLDLRYQYVQQSRIASDQRDQLPNYQDIAWAKKHFEELKEAKTTYTSYVGWRRIPFSGQTINIDQDGIRETDSHPLADSSSPIAVFLGGSTIWGSGVSDAYTIPSFFARKSPTAYRVLNLGESAYCAYQGYLFLQSRILKGLSPDLVISYDGVNNSPAHLPTFWKHSAENLMADRLKRPDDGSINNLYTLKSTIDLIKRGKGYVSRQRDVSSGKSQIPQERHEQAAKELLDSWVLTQQLCREQGADFMAILQPNVFVGNPITSHIAASIQDHPYQHSYAYYEEVIRMLDLPRYQALKPDCLILTHAFDDMADVYIDFCHVSPNGNERIVDLILEWQASREE